ncbi:MAG: GlxA family transcriptional regulator, partial [Shimia sp.]
MGRLTLGILLWPSFPLMSLSGLVESLRHAGDHGDDSHFRYTAWEVLGAPGQRFAASCGIEVEATASYPPPEAFDRIVVIGGLLRDLGDAPPAQRRYLHAARAAGVPILAVCTGCFVVAEEGLLGSGPAAVHPYHQQEFRAAWPNISQQADCDYASTSDGAVTTVLGGTSILPLMTEIIAERFGPDRAAKTVYQMTLPSRQSLGPMDPIGPARPPMVSDPRIQKALVILDAVAARDPSVAELARSLGLSERHLLRLFRSQVGKGPKDYLIDVKLRAAVWMLRNTTRSITSIAYAAGFSSGASLAVHCRNRLGSSPTDIRREGGDR